MPAVSEAQRKAMYAAAEGRSTLGIPASVGKEFVKADSDKIKSAGIAYLTPEGKLLLIKRGHEQDHPDEWAFPGGHLDKDEKPEEAAIREFSEEVGIDVANPIFIGQFDHFAVYKAVGDVLDVKLSSESQDYGFFSMDDLPQPMHPRALAVLHSEEFIRAGMNELQIAHAMSSGALSSPQQYANTALFKIRITGTGVAYRSARERFTWRSPSDYLNPGFLQRCNGLPVILEHPDSGSGLMDGEEFQKRIIGTVLYPYIEGDDVNGIAKIWDEASAEMMQTQQLSTSPLVVTSKDATLVLDNGDKCTVEGAPVVLDHVAVCAHGVWDKGGEPSGVKNDSEDSKMSDDPKVDTHEPLKAIADSLEKLHSRMDSFEKKIKKLKKGKKDDDMPTPELDEAKKDAEAEEEVEEEKEEPKVKADSDLRAEIDRMRAMLPKALSDAELNQLSDTQAKADAVYNHFGDSAPRYMQGESPLQYRRRLVAKLQSNSTKWKDIDLGGVDEALLGIAEAEIYADSVTAASRPTETVKGSLRPIVRKSASGHTITEWVGDQEMGAGGFWAKSQTVRFNK